MSRHTITIDELDKCLATESWHEIVMSYGSGSSKKLEVNGDRTILRVTDHGRVTYIGGTRETAVRLYNEAR